MVYHRLRPKWFMSQFYVWCKPCTYRALTLIMSPNTPKWDSTWPTSPWSSIGCLQNYFWAYGTSAQTVHLSYVKMSTITKWPKWTSSWASSTGVPSGSSKMISEPMVHLAQTVHLSFIQMELNKIPHDPRHVGFPSGASKMISDPMVRSAHTVHLSCIKICTISKWSEMRLQLSLITL
jgi:hypothetical protein